jgi:hypothetical protein
VEIDANLEGQNSVIVPASALERMAAEPGDLLYASHRRWWYGGLRSVHVKAGPAAVDEERPLMRISPQDASTGHFTQGQEIRLEKIM